MLLNPLAPPLHGTLLWLLMGSLALAGYPTLSSKVLRYVERTYGQQAEQRVADWRELMQRYRYASEAEKLRQTNMFFNRLEFVSDEQHWGRRDYWATPLEFLGTDGGDCEDFSIAKYFTLLEMGVPEDKLRIAYVKALSLGQAHMVLTYYRHPRDEPLVLDNLIGEIKPASRRKDLKPVYSFNGSGLWAAVERGRGKRVSGSERISLWRDLKQRMQREADR